MTGLVAAGAFLASRYLTLDPVIHLGVAAIPVLLPLARVEAVANLANAHWQLLYLMFWILFVRPCTRLEAIAWAAVATVACLTEIQRLVFAPVVAVRLIRVPSSRLVLSGWVIGIAGQTATFLASYRERNEGVPSLASTMKGYMVNVVLGEATGAQSVVDTVLAHLGWALAVLMLAVIRGMALCVGIRGPQGMRWAVLAAVSGSAASWVLAFSYNNPGYKYAQPPYWLTQWGTAAALLLLAVLPLYAQVLANRGARGRTASRFLIAGMVLVITVSLQATYRSGESWSDTVDTARDECDVGEVTVARIHQLPAGWTFPVDCARFP